MTGVPRRLAARHGLPLLVLVLNALWVIGSCLPAPAARLLGDPRYHAVDSCWFHYMVTRGALSWPPTLQPNAFDYPDGWPILDLIVDLGNTIVALPMTAAIGAIASHNLFNGLLIAAAGVAAYALGLQVLRGRTAALAAGLLYADMDPMFFAVKWGEDDVAALWVIPAFWAVLLWARDRIDPREGEPRPRRQLVLTGLVAGAALGITGWFNSYYLLFNLLFTAIVGLGMLSRRQRWRATLVFFLAFGLVAATLYAPRTTLGKQAWTTRHWSSALIEEPIQLVRAPEGVRAGSNLDVSGLLNPFSPWRHGEIQRRETAREGFLYLGWGVVALAALGFVRARPRRRRTLILVGTAGLLLALGSHVQVEGRLLELGGYNLPGPWAVLTGFLPPLGALKHPYRFALLLYLAAAVLAGGGVGWICSRWSGWRRRGTFAFLLVICVAERLLAHPGLAPVESHDLPVPAALFELEPPPGRPAVLQLPLEEDYNPIDMEGSRYHRFLQIRAHGLPLVARVGGRWPFEPLSPERTACELIEQVHTGVGLILAPTELEEMQALFHRQDEPWERAVTQAARQRLEIARGNLRQVLEPEWQGEGMEIYRLPEASELLPPAGCGFASPHYGPAGPPPADREQALPMVLPSGG
jgi:hypothetical protein